MMDQPSLCCAILLVFRSLTCSSHLGNAKSVDYGIATLSTSWTINNPPPILNASEFVWRPILFRRGLLSRFSLGFCCNFAYTYCIVGVFVQKQTSVNEDSITDAPQLVWSANRNHSVKLNATLHLTQHGDLTLADADGTSVWSTNTGRAGGGGGKYSVLGLNLTEDGNLVLFDQNNATVWQSFDYRTDSLLPGQKLVLGQKLIASTSASNWSQGLYSLAIHLDPGLQGYLEAYLESNPPFVYFKSYLDTNSDHQVYVKFENGSFNGQKIFHDGSSVQLMRLEPDGHLRVYVWAADNWIAVDLLTSDIGDCGYPMACGNYGICYSNGQCRCLEEAPSNNTFRQINSRQPSLGCSLVTPISCNHSQKRLYCTRLSR